MEHRLIQGGEQYLPFARSRIKALRATGLRYASQQFEVGGVSVKVRIEGDHEYITLTESVGYMESGFQQMLSYDKGLASTYKPAVIHFSPYVALHSTKKNNAMSKKVADSDESQSNAGTSGKAKEKTTTVSIGTDGGGITFTSDTAVFATSPDIIFSAKQLRRQCPPSAFTGKMRQYVQALYGTKRTDYDLGFDAAGAVIALKTTAHTALPVSFKMPTFGLITLPLDAGYLLVQVANSGVLYWKMKNTGASKSAIQAALGKDASALDVESFLLSQLVPVGTASVASGTGMSSVVGGPLAYGWHFNSAGSEASIVCRTSKTITTKVLTSGAASSIGGLTCTLYKAVFTYAPGVNGADGVLTYAVSAVESGDHIPFIETRIYTPNFMTGVMDLLQPGSGGPIYSSYAATGPTPIYCYYDGTDSLVVVRARNATFTTVPAATNPPGTGAAIASVLGGRTTVGTGVWSSYPVSYLFGDSSLSVGSTTYPGNWKTSPGTTTTITYNVVGGPIVSGVQYIDNTLTTQDTVTRTGVSGRSYALLAIPFGDASSVVAGYRQVSQGTMGTSNRATFSNNIWLTGAPAYMGASAYIWSPAGSAMELWSASAGSVPTTQLGTDSCSVSVNLHSAYGMQSLGSYSSSAPWGTANEFSDRPYIGLFEAAIATDPSYTHEMTVHTSIQGAMRHQSLLDGGAATPAVYTNGWPTDTDTPTGWA